MSAPSEVGTGGCAHMWRYTGVRFRDGTHPIPGSSACIRYYGHHTMCEKCGVGRIERLPASNGRTSEKVDYNATPATVEEFPIEHEKGNR